MTAPRKDRFHPTLKQRIMLADLIRANPDKTAGQLAEMAGPMIDHRVNYDHIKNAAKVLDLPIKKQVKARANPLEVLIGAVADLYERLGEPVPPSVAALGVKRD